MSPSRKLFGIQGRRTEQTEGIHMLKHFVALDEVAEALTEGEDLNLSVRVIGISFEHARLESVIGKAASVISALSREVILGSGNV